nr:hypothetical protein [Tanacetum cinerariifolium]
MKTAGKWNVPTLTKTSSATPTRREIERSVSLRVIHVGDSLGRESLFHTDNGMRFMLAPRSARAKHSAILRKSHGMRNLPGFPSFSGNFLRRTVEQCSFSGVLDSSDSLSLAFDHEVWMDMELKAFDPLRVVIPFRSSFGLITVLPRRVPEPKDEASQIVVEKSGADEPKLGNPELDKLEVDDQTKWWHDVSRSEEEIQMKGVIRDSIYFDALGDMQETRCLLASSPGRP